MGIPIKVRDRVLERDNGLCIVQGPLCLGEAQVAHHRANRGAGGASSGVLNQMSNLASSCSPCNGWIEDSHGAARDELVRRGLRLLTDSTHAKTALRALVTPVEYPDGRLFYLLDDGGLDEIDTTPI